YTLATGESYYSPPTVEQRANIDEIQAYDWQIHRIALPDGSEGVVCYFYDLSEIKRAEEIIRRTAQRDAFLVTLSDTLRPLADPMEIQATATQILGEYLGVNRALYFEVRGSDYVVERDYVNGANAIAGTYPIDSFGQSLIETYRSGRTVVQPDVSADPSLSPERQAAYIAIEIIAHIGIPLIKNGELVAGLAVHMNRSRVWTQEEVTLAEEVAERTWAAIERARAEVALAKSEEKYRSLFDSIDEGFSLIEMIFDAAGEPINYRFLEVNQAFEQQTGLVGVTGKTILDVIPDFEGSFIERYGRVAIEGKSVRFQRCVTAMDNSWFNIYASRVGGEGSRQVAIVFDNITDRKRREANLAFLAAIAEDFSRLSTVEEIIQAVGAKIGAHLQVTNCNFCEVDEVGDELVYLGRWNADMGDRLPDRICISEQTSEDFCRRVRAGETIASDNTQTNPVTNAEANAAIGALSFITVPFHKDGEWKYLFSIHDSIPRVWRSDEIELVRELAHRTVPRLDRARAEAALRDSEKRLSLFVKHAPACVAMFDRQMNYLALSQRWVDQYHLGAIETVVGRSHYELLPTIPDRWRQVYRQGLEGLIQRCDEDRFTLPDGSLQWLKWEVQPWETGTGEVGGILIFVEDISDRKLAEEKIREQAALLDIASDAIFVRDLEHRILYWNQGAERLYGWTAAEAIDRKTYELLQIEVTQVSEITQTILDRGEWRGELQKIAKSDREVIVEASWTLVRDDAGQPKFILSVETDITEKKQLEAQFYHAQRLESLGTLASGIAHDLNNVLTPILAISQLLRYQHTNLDARSQKMLQMLEDSSKRGANLVKQILTFARGNESERISLSVIPLLQEAVQIAQQTFPKSIAVRHNLAGEIGLVSADPTQLHQIFVNLCVNARDAMPDGGTLAISAENYYVDEIFAQMHPDARVGNYVCVTVADTGTGIPPEIRDRIFEPFFTTKDIGKGTGLGLSILLGIVKSYEGFVEVRSQPGAGSQFKVYLPILQAVSALVEEQTNLPRGQGETILVVDDEANILQVARTLLESYNYRVLTASNGIEALARYIEHKHEIQVVLMDMMMPEMDGFKAINTLQKMNPQIKIVAISGLSSDYRKKARSLGIDNFLSKPFTATELLQSIMTVDS
ncbi:MAG: hybrid sensor histidine kinase/response regulator, partial [Microcoleus sp.]